MTHASEPSDLELAALISSKICHDVISPVGAIYNGLEILGDDGDPGSRDYAMDVIRNVTVQASARLQFARFAFGAAGSAGAEIDLQTAREISEGFIGDAKHKLEWSAPSGYLPKNQVKLLLNLVLIGLGGIPRGGVLTVTMSGNIMGVRAEGQGAKASAELSAMVAGEMPESGLDARSIQIQYTLDLAGNLGLDLAVDAVEGSLEVNARPRAEAAA